MLRRDTNYYAGRGSMALVDEARGVPFQYVCYFMCLINTLYAVRTAFSCKTTFFYEGETMIQIQENMFGDCENDPWKKFLVINMGGYIAIVAIARFWVATATHVADLYSSMILLVVHDTSAVYSMFAAVGFGGFPIFYQVFMVAGLGYEIYVLLLAQRAHSKRLKSSAQMRELKNM